MLNPIALQTQAFYLPIVSISTSTVYLVALNSALSLDKSSFDDVVYAARDRYIVHILVSGTPVGSTECLKHAMYRPFRRMNGRFH